MPDDGWSEPWPRRPEPHGVWDQFVASLEPDELERERMRAPDDMRAERFGSREHHETMHAHEYVAEQVRRDRDELDRTIAKLGTTPEQAAVIVRRKRENQIHHHTRGTAA